MDDWELSAARAAVVARQIQLAGRIPSFYLAVAGRAGQNHLYRVIVFYGAKDPASDQAFRALDRAGIGTYSRRNVYGGDATALQDWRRRGLTTVPVIRLQDSDDQEQTVPLGDAALQDLARKWAQNDRVEVLVEYSQNQPGVAPG